MVSAFVYFFMFYDSAVKRYKQQMREEMFWLEFNVKTVKEAN